MPHAFTSESLTNSKFLDDCLHALVSTTILRYNINTMTSNDEYVIQLLQERGFLTEEQIDAASKSMKAENETTLDVLVSSGVIGEDEVLGTVADQFGLKYCHVNAEADDILDAIADAYLTVGCAVMTPNRRRFDMIPALIEEFHADAVLDIALSSCHTYLIEGRSLREFCRGMGVPYMALETDYSQLDAGQIDTRIAAFVESL